jgi:hypothetical protein
VFTRWFLKHIRKVFGEMSGGLELLFDSFFVVVVSHVTLLASIVVFLYVFRLANSVSGADNFSIAIWSLLS